MDCSRDCDNVFLYDLQPGSKIIFQHRSRDVGKVAAWVSINPAAEDASFVMPDLIRHPVNS
jgi:hypothetical protein